MYDIIKERAGKLKAMIEQWQTKSRYLDLRYLFWIYQKHMDYLKDPKKWKALLFLIYYHAPGSLAYPTTLIITCMMSITKAIKFH